MGFIFVKNNIMDGNRAALGWDIPIPICPINLNSFSFSFPLKILKTKQDRYDSNEKLSVSFSSIFLF